jgi:hypothetical protein
MKWLLLILLFLPSIGYSQVFNLNYRYTEVCSEETRTKRIPININDNTTITFFGNSRTFTQEQVDNDEHRDWLKKIYDKWDEYYPCAEIKALVSESSVSISEKSEVDSNRPIVVMSADFGYRNEGVLSSNAGYNVTNTGTKESRGGLITFGTDYLGNIGYYRISPLTKSINSVVNVNILLLSESILGNLTNGYTLKKTKFGSGFVFHTMTFGRLNEYPFQDNTLTFGYNKEILDTRRFFVSTNVLVNYTYRVKVFNIKYWFEDHVTVKPFFNLGIKVTPTFGLNLSYTNMIRTDEPYTFKSDEDYYHKRHIFKDRYAILLGGRVLF